MTTDARHTRLVEEFHAARVSWWPIASSFCSIILAGLEKPSVDVHLPVSELHLLFAQPRQ
jgi:hypothetical protein